MAFRIHKGIFQNLNAEGTAYENAFKVDRDGIMKTVSGDGTVGSAFLKVGDKASDSDNLDGVDSGSFLRSDATDSYNATITATGGDWYLWGLGTRGASAGAYGIGNRSDDSYRQMTFHVPNQAAYSGSGTIPSFGWYSNGAVQLMKLNSDSGNLWLKGSSEFDGRVYADNGVHVRGDWLRVNGSNGIYFESYAGGWHMTDTSWIRAYNNKNIYTGGTIESAGVIRADNGFQVDGNTVIDGSGVVVTNINNDTTDSNYFIQAAHGQPRNNLGSPTVTEMALFNEQFNNKTAFYDPSKITVWKQATEGAEWEDITANYGDTAIRRFIAGYDSSNNIYIPNGVYKFRIEVSAVSYVFLNALYIYWSSNSHSTKVHIYTRRVSDQVWLSHTSSSTNVSSWPGHLYLPFSSVAFLPGPHPSTGHRDIIRFEFIPNWSTGQYSDRNIDLYKMQVWGGYPSGTRYPYSVNEYGDFSLRRNLNAPGIVYANGGNSDNWNTAYGWGNHASANYLTSVPSEYLTQTEGDARYLQSLPSHNHTDIHAGHGYINSGDWNNIIATHSGDSSMGGGIYRVESSTTNPPVSGVYNWSLYQQGTALRGSQLALSAYGSGNRMFFRGANVNTGFYRDWAEVWHSDNFNPANKADASHNHDDRYYTETEVDNLIGTRAPSSHTHLFIKPYREYGSYIRNADTPLTLKTEMGGGGLRVDFLNGASFNTWSHAITWSGYDGYNMYQLAGNYKGSAGEGPDLYVRCEPNHARDSWSNWQKLWHDGHFSSTDVTNWNTAYGWGNHADYNYLTSVPSEYLTQTEGDARYLQSLPSHNHDSRYNSTDGSGNDYRWSVNLGSGTGTRWYKVGTVNVGSGGMTLRGLISNHVESFATQQFDIAIQGREGNNSNAIEITGNVNVLHGGVGVFVVSGEKPGPYLHWDVYIVTVDYAMAHIDLTKTSSTFHTSNSYVTSIPEGTVELDTTTLAEGNYVIDDSVAKEIYHEGHKPSYSELGTMGYSNLTGTPTLGTAAAAATGDFATAAQGIKADSALQSLPSHNHDDRYYTETEINTLLANYRGKTHFTTNNGYSDYYSGGSAGWYRVAEIVLNSNCGGATLYGTLYDHRYDGADAYQVSIVARSECNFTTDNESHYVNVGCTILGSTNYSDYRSKIRVVLVESATNVRRYEVQFYETPWNRDTWQLQTGGSFTIYEVPQAPRDAVGTARVYYRSTQNADYQRANTAMYAPIYYDNANANYYLDPASTSVLNALTVGGSAVLTTANEGSGNGIDADTVDGIHASNLFRTDGTYPNTNFDAVVEGYWHIVSGTGTTPVDFYGHRWDYDHLNNGQWAFQMYAPTSGDDDLWIRQIRNYQTQAWRKIWHTGNLNPADYAAASHNHDDRYYTETESDARYLQSLPSHNHDADYVNVGGDTMTGMLKLNAGITNDNWSTFTHLQGAWSVGNAGGTGGAIRIELPVSEYNTNTMMSMTIKVYEYNTGKSFTLLTGGYNYHTGTWYNCFATLLGDDQRGDIPVYFGNDGTRNVIWIGNPDWSWSYPNVWVTDFQSGHTQGKNWNDGWRIIFDQQASVNVTASETAHQQISTANIASQSVNYAGSAGAVAWANVSGKPSTFAPDAHNHNDIYYTETEVDTLLSGKLGSTAKAADSDLIDGIDSSRIVYGDGSNGRSVSRTNGSANASDASNASGFYFGNNVAGMPTTDWWNWLTVRGNAWSGTDGYQFQLAGSFWSDDYRIRRMQSGTNQAWVSLIHSGNIGSQTVAVAGTANAVTWANVSGKPSTFSPSAHTHTPTEVGLSSLSSNGNSLAGSFTATGDITAYSDSRIKENVTTIDSALDKVMSLRGVEYNKIGSEEKSLGVIAQEIREVLPEVVKEQEDGMLSVAYGNITAVLIEALKEQQKQIDELKAQIDAITK